MIKVLEGTTYRMLKKDKRVQEIVLQDGQVEIVLAAPWVYGMHSLVRGHFSTWEDARNWVRKADKNGD